MSVGSPTGAAAEASGAAGGRQAADPERSHRLDVPASAEAAELIAPKRGPGRPAGSRNIRDEETALQLIETYGDPLEADVSIGNMPTGELVTMLRKLASDRGLKLGMTIGDIVRWQQSCRGQALPYLHAKRLSVAVTPQPKLPMFGLGRASTVVGPGGGRSIEHIEGNQRLSDPAGDVSHGAVSHDEGSD